jgi:hypothetical protein
MAKPIAPTPILEGEDAYHFLLEMAKPPSKEKKEMLERIKNKDYPILF